MAELIHVKTFARFNHHECAHVVCSFLARIALLAGVAAAMAILRQCLFALMSTYASSLQVGNAMTPPSEIVALQERDDFPGTGSMGGNWRFVERTYPNGVFERNE